MVWRGLISGNELLDDSKSKYGEQMAESFFKDGKTDIVFGTLTNFATITSPDRMNDFNNGIELIPDQLQFRNPSQYIIEYIKSYRKTLPYLDYPYEGFALLEMKNATMDTLLKKRPNLIQLALFAFRLLKAGDIFLDGIYTLSLDSEIKLVMVFDPKPFNLSLYNFKFEEIDKLIGILGDLQNIDFDEDPYFRIAWNRFGRTYHDNYLEDKIIDFCIAYEALFLKEEYQKSELGMGQVIGLACSMLLGKDNAERADIKNNIESGFNLRNKVVHGYEIDVNRRKRIIEILPDFENNLRRSILRLIP